MMYIADFYLKEIKMTKIAFHLASYKLFIACDVAGVYLGDDQVGEHSCCHLPRRNLQQPITNDLTSLLQPSLLQSTTANHK